MKTMTTKTIAITALIIGTLACVGAQGANDPLAAIDAKANIKGDLSAEYAVVHQKPQEPPSRKVSQVFRRDASDRFLVLIKEPVVDKNKGYLRLGESLWLYDPKDRQFTLTNARERFESSNARLSDFCGSSWSKDYSVVSRSSEQLGKYDCAVFLLKAKRADILFPSAKIWVDKDNIVRKSLDYTLSGELARTVFYPSWQDSGAGWLPAKILVQDNLRGKTVGGKFVFEETQITIGKPTMKKIPDGTFSKEYLEKLQK